MNRQVNYKYEASALPIMGKEKSCGTICFLRHKEGIKYLLLHYATGHWDFPKGHVEKSEKEEQTAIRELKEETGIEVSELVDGFREAVNYFYKSSSETMFKEVVFFLAEAGTNHVAISNEHIGYAWLNYEHATNKVTFNNAKELLKKANDFLKKT